MAGAIFILLVFCILSNEKGMDSVQQKHQIKMYCREMEKSSCHYPSTCWAGWYQQGAWEGRKPKGPALAEPSLWSRHSYLFSQNPALWQALLARNKNSVWCSVPITMTLSNILTSVKWPKYFSHVTTLTFQGKCQLGKCTVVWELSHILGISWTHQWPNWTELFLMDCIARDSKAQESHKEGFGQQIKFPQSPWPQTKGPESQQSEASGRSKHRASGHLWFYPSPLRFQCNSECNDLQTKNYFCTHKACSSIKSCTFFVWYPSHTFRIRLNT